MKKIKQKMICLLIPALFFISCQHSFAIEPLTNDLDFLINQNKLNNSSIISVSIRDLNTGAPVYQKYSSLYLHPASTLKTFTLPVIQHNLGNNYKIKTSLYKNKNNIYLKLSGDPFLTSADLNNLLKMAKDKGLKKIKWSIIIDDSVFDQIPYGKGWMWDDIESSDIPKYSPYNLDHNNLTLNIKPLNGQISIKINPDYNVKIINNAVISDKNTLTATKRPYLSSNTIYLSGGIKTPQSIQIPVESPKDYFIYQLKQELATNHIEYNPSAKTGKIPDDAELLAETSHNLKDELITISHLSDNMAIESLFKFSAAAYSHSQGTTDKGIKSFKDFYSNLGVDLSGIKIVDASGVSFYNLLYTDWMSDALFKLNKFDNTYAEILPMPTENGTLKNRLNNINATIHAKTGTLSGVSGLTGYINTPKNNYCFAILIQNFSGSSSSAKNLEDNIIQTLSKY